jgi:coproporphyrinogen III oxidase
MGIAFQKQMHEMVRNAQDQICKGLSAIEDCPFREDTWSREEGGGGISRVIQHGNVFEKAGVNVSAVIGELPESALKSMGGGQEYKGDDRRFFATGVSLVLHPHNPMAPTVHANYRYFEIGDGEQPGSWWFGGGSDLTPSYLFEEDAVHFHAAIKSVCDRHDIAFYPRFKAWCDRYFFIPHRGEHRGLGGLFFDNLNDRRKELLFAFSKDCTEHFLDSYIPILERRINMPFNDRHKTWQAIRRGRYVEFNLVYDRGTVFGLKTGGRIESILMSLPVHAQWEYCHEVQPESEEARLLAALKTPKDWI